VADDPRSEDLTALVGSAVGGDKKALAELRAWQRRDPAAIVPYGCMSRQVEEAWYTALLGEDDAPRFLLKATVAERRRELLGPAPSAVERLLVDRVVATYLEVSAAAYTVAEQGSVPLSLAEFRQHWLDRAQRRHLHALKTLAQVRRLLQPVVPGEHRRAAGQRRPQRLRSPRRGVSAGLERVCCARPSCPGAQRGRPRLLLLARLQPGSVVEPVKCRSCGWVTRLSIGRDGRPELRARPAPTAPDQFPRACGRAGASPPGTTFVPGVLHRTS
jgi:hypothetical protein